jgi:hypothetical protein
MKRPPPSKRAQHYLTRVCNLALLLNGLTMTLTLSCGLRASLSLCGLRASLSLCGLRASLRVTGLSTGYGPLYGLWASLSLRAMGISPCGLWVFSLRVMGFLPAGYGRFPLRVMGILLAGYGRLYGLLVLLSLRTTIADLLVPHL